MSYSNMLKLDAIHDRSDTKAAGRMRQAWRTVALLTVLVAAVPAAWSSSTKSILVIGGPRNQSTGQHEYFHGVRAIKTLLVQSGGIKGSAEVEVREFPFGWPDSRQLEGASAIVLYLDGGERHPLLDAQRRAVFDKLMASGVGLVTLHTASTPPRERADDFRRWLGITSAGPDATSGDATVSAAPVNNAHPISQGIAALNYTVEADALPRTSSAGEGVTPILAGRMTPHSSPEQTATPSSREIVAAWAFQRPGGGRSFAFTGAHSIDALDIPSVRTLVLNAIYWSAGLEVPAGGVQSAAEPRLASKLANPRHGRPPIETAVLSRAENNEVVNFPWGRINWHVSGPLGNSDSMTTGIVMIDPGEANPRHFHPNCDEVLHVLHGRIRHTMNEVTVEMGPGDTVSIPKSVVHNATNIGTDRAVMAISFSSPWREVVGE
jgi:quercetin dioxygenase-like cupin family protein/type 1 glutamine amidotransferase